MHAAVEHGEYDRGLTLYPTLAAPSATDTRWMGICLHHDGRYAEAELHLHQAAQGGDLAAFTYLAAVHISRGQTPEALACLTRVSPDDLPPEEAALWLRERARTGWMMGESRTQLLAWGQQAWQGSAPASTNVQVSVATSLASLGLT